MSEQQIDAQRLAQSIAAFRQAQQSASRSLVVLECTLNNVAGELGLPRPTAGLSSLV